MKLAHWLVAVSFFTASFDVLLNINIGGSLRFCQVLMIGVCIAAFARMIQDGRVLWPRGSSALALWLVVQAMFIPLSGVMTIGIEFFVLLLFTVVCVLAVVQLYGQSEHIEALMRVYLLSYVFVAVFGLVQFALPLLGLPSLFVRQWIAHGRVARISGFSYEPSFFATYLIMGWIMLVELRYSNARITQGRYWKWATIVVTAALFLSTSKTAWVFMLLEAAVRFAPPLGRTLWRMAGEARRGKVSFRAPTRRFATRALILGVVVLICAGIVSRLVKDPYVFLSGSGLAHTPSHSLDIRYGTFIGTWQAYKMHPFIGRSLGGVSVYMASINGIQVTDMEGVRHFWGFPVLMDVLVASGLFGFIPFLVYLYANTFGALRQATRYWPEERAKWLRALARAMVFEWLLLFVDQNLLRTYLWFHFSMVTVVAYHVEFAPAPVPVSRPSQSSPLLGDPATAL